MRTEDRTTRGAPGADLVYLDHNATSPLLPEAADAMGPLLSASANASSAHRLGQAARTAIERAREEVARLLGGVDPGGVIFTSGGTESCNLAVRGVAAQRRDLALVATAVEHPAVLHTLEDLARAGRSVELLPVDRDGRLHLAAAAPYAHRPALLSIMLANHEVGTVQPVAEAAAAVRHGGGLVFVDAVQGAGKLPLSPEAWGADLVALSGHKLGAPQGVGVLWVRSGVALAPLLTGGAQERNRRGGTENAPAIAAMGAAARFWRERGAALASDLERLRDELESRVLAAIPGSFVLGVGASRVPNTTLVVIPGLDAESLVFALDLEGICASTGAACATGSAEPSHVVRALGVAEEHGRSCLRLSTGWSTVRPDIARAADVLPRLAARLREAEGGAS